MQIPVYTISVPEYKLKKFNSKSEKVNYALTPFYTIQIPKIYIDNKPDFAKIGAKIDKCLKQHFINKKVAIRVLSSQEHKGKNIDEIIEITKKIGHDRYDPKRKGDRYKNIENKKIDFFALDFKVKAKGKYFENLIEPFYFWPIVDRKQPIRIDIAIIYDLSKLEMVEHQYKGREDEIKRDGFIFKNPENKPNAILGIIKILSNFSSKNRIFA
jgi:hypothetical protein